MLTWILVAILAGGCDPGGLRRVHVQLQNPPSGTANISVDSADVQEALQIVDNVVIRHGFRPALLGESGHGEVRLYYLDVHESAYGQSWEQEILCHVKLVPTGIEIEFGERGFLAPYDAANGAFRDTYTALVKRYGKNRVIKRVFR